MSTKLGKHCIQRQSQTCSVKTGVLRNFTKFTGKYLCQSLFFNKVTGVRPATFFQKRLWHGCFSVNFVKFLRTLFLQNTSGRLFLHSKIVYYTQYCTNTSETTLHKKITCLILALSAQQWFWRKITHTILFSPALAKIAQNNNLYIADRATRGVL